MPRDRIRLTLMTLLCLTLLLRRGAGVTPDEVESEIEIIFCYGGARIEDRTLASTIHCVDEEIIEWLARHGQMQARPSAAHRTANVELAKGFVTQRMGEIMREMRPSQRASHATKPSEGASGLASAVINVKFQSQYVARRARTL